MKVNHWDLLLTLSVGLAIAPGTIAQTPPPPSSPPLSSPEQEELQRLRREKQIQQLVNDNLKNSAFVRDLVQSEVDRAFGVNTNLLNLLLTLLTLAPIILAIAGFLVRRNIIQEAVMITRHDLRAEVEKQLSEEARQGLVDQIVLEAIGRLQKDLDKQTVEAIAEIKQQIADLQDQFTAQLSTLQIQTAEALAVQPLKEQLIQAIDKLTPSPAQEDSVSSDIQHRIQELTEQLEQLKSTTPQLLLTASDYFRQGEAFYFEGRYDDALSSYDDAIRLKPDDPTTWINRAITLRRLQRFEEAIASHDKAIALDPDYPRVWYTKGYTLRRYERYGDAIACYDRSIQLEIDAYRSWDNRGSALKEMGQFAAAIDSYERAIAIKPDYSNVWNHKARCYALWGKPELAIESLRRSIELRPDYRSSALTEPDFEGIRENAAFMALIEQPDEPQESMESSDFIPI